jgi:mannose-6-phosphate isomerase
MACLWAEIPASAFAKNANDLFVGKTLLHGDVLMWLMKTLLTSRCINQRRAGHVVGTLYV